MIIEEIIEVCFFRNVKEGKVVVVAVADVNDFLESWFAFDYGIAVVQRGIVVVRRMVVGGVVKVMHKAGVRAAEEVAVGGVVGGFVVG